MGACRAVQRQIWGLVELIFLTELLTLRTDLGLLNWILADSLALEHKNCQI